MAGAPTRAEAVYGLGLPGDGRAPFLTGRAAAIGAATLAGAALSWVAGAGEVAAAFALFAAILLGQVVNPILRDARHRTGPALAEALFLLPFVGFFLPFYLGLLWVDLPLATTWIAAAAGLATGLALRWPERAAIRRAWHAARLRRLPPAPGLRVLLRGHQAMASAVSQEMFYRGVLFALLAGRPPALIAAFASLLFVAEHAANRWAGRKYGRGQYLRFAATSVLWSVVTILAGSPVPAMISHVTFNATGLIPLVLAWSFGASGRRGRQPEGARP